MSSENRGIRPIGAALCGVMMLGGITQAHAQESITFNSSWLPQGSIVGVGVALHEGWFAEAGLDVNIVRGYGGGRTANELDQGQFEIGYVDPTSIAMTRANGGAVRLIGAINTEWPGGICYDRNRHDISSIDDLDGLTMGGGSASPVHNVVPAWLEINGKPRDFVRMLRMDPAVVDASLIEGQIDLAECWRGSNRAVMQKRAADSGVDLAWIEYSDHGLDTYGSSFAARDDYIADKPEVLRAFLDAAYRGYAWAAENPEAAADVMMALFDTLDRDVVLQQIREITVLITDAEVSDRGLGHLREDRMASTMAFITSAFELPAEVSVEDIYTNEVLP